MDRKTEQVEVIARRLSGCEAKRGNFASLWQDVTELVIPRKSNVTVQKTPGVRQELKQYESTAAICAALLAARLYSNLTSTASRWFKLRLDGVLENTVALAGWLEEVSDIVAVELNRPAANLALNLHECYLDLVTLGTAALYVGWDDEKNALMFQSLPMSHIFIDENEKGVVDTVFRRFKMTIEQTARVYGVENLPDELKNAENQPERELMLVQAIYRNPDYDDKKLALPLNRRFRSVVYWEQNKHVLKVSGYHELPIIVCRWEKTSGEVYGRSPAIGCLADIKMLQLMMKETLIAAQLANRPPTLVKDEDSFNPINTVPGGTIVYRDTPPAPYNPGVKPNIGIEIMNEIRERIRTAFFIDQTMTAENPNWTATEALIRKEESMQFLGPVLGRIQSELLSMMIERCVGLLSRAGRLPEAPADVGRQDVSVSIEYISPAAMAQKQTTAGNLSQALQVVTPLLQLDQNAALQINCDKGVRDVFERFGLETILRDEEEATAIYEAQNAQMNEQAQIDRQAQLLSLEGMKKDVQNA